MLKVKVLRYTEEIQKQLKTSVKAEPWLHIAVIHDFERPAKHTAIPICIYAIFVWDTRKILAGGIAKYQRVNGIPANDNFEPLVGNISGYTHTIINSALQDKQNRR